MQTKLDTAIDLINGHIYDLNKKTKVTTPFLHHTIRERRGQKGHRYIAYRWEKLKDGLHAADTLHPIWAETFQKAMELNSMLEDVDEHGPKKTLHQIQGREADGVVILGVHPLFCNHGS